MGDFLHTGKADQICAESKTCALSCSDTNRGAHRVKDGKHDRGENREGRDFIKWQSLLGDKDRSSGNHETFNEILNNAIHNFSKSVAHHFSIFIPKKKTHPNTKLSLKLLVTETIEMSTAKKVESVEESVVEDFLDEDAEISGQRYVLLSFLSPEKVLDKKDF